MVAEPPLAARSNKRRRFVRALKVVVVVGVIVALALSVRSQWDTVRHDFARLPVRDGIAAIALALVATGSALLGWRVLLADLGSRLPLVASLYVYALSQLGKYVPGSVWPVLGQMELGRAFQIPRLRSATAFLLSLFGSLVSATAVGGLLAFTSPGWGRAFALLPLVLVIMHPRVLIPVIGIVARVLRRSGVTETPSLAGVGKALVFLVVQWLVLGASTTLMAHGLGSSVSWTRCIAAVSLAWAAGLAVVIVPAGAGVREGVLTLLLAPSMGGGRALAVALLGRLALTIADAVGAVVGAIVARRALQHQRIIGDGPIGGDGISGVPVDPGDPPPPIVPAGQDPALPEVSGPQPHQPG